MFNNKTLLISGGTGSFGNAVLNRFINSEIKEIRIFSRDEKKQDDMRNRINNPKVKFFIGDVRDISSINQAMGGVDYVFHAAALKQVPSCEFFPMQAVQTNIIGTQNLINSAIKNHVEKVIVLSTDKAVYPINAMGISKAMMEKIMIASSRDLSGSSKTTICGTRYGNVMASRGSVIPLFIKQIKNGENITITDPNMTRFMMTLEDAVDLVIFAFKNGNNGDIFVQKAPAATIKTLANSLLKLYRSDNEIKIIGTRHGEKLYEALVNREDMAKAEDLKDYFRIPADNRDLNYNRFFTEGKEHISEIEDYHSHNTKRLDEDGMIKLLMKLPLVKRDLLNEESLNHSDMTTLL